MLARVSIVACDDEGKKSSARVAMEEEGHDGGGNRDPRWEVTRVDRCAGKNVLKTI